MCTCVTGMRQRVESELEMSAPSTCTADARAAMGSPRAEAQTRLFFFLLFRTQSNTQHQIETEARTDRAHTV